MNNEITNTDNDNNEIKLEELKQYATDLGITYRENIGIPKLEEKIEEKENEIAQERREKKVEAKKQGEKKITITVEPRERDAGIEEQFFGFNSMKTGAKENILIQFGEEVEVTQRMFDHIKNITFKTKKFKMVTDQDGIPQKEWYDKTQTRFIVSKV